jgi:hypothetical protein
MNRFAELLDRLAYEPGRNNKLRLITAYFRETADPDRGYALAALTGALSFKHAKPGLIRDLITDRTDPVLFGLSYDYVGDLSETVALMWPKAATQAQSAPSPACGGGIGGLRPPSLIENADAKHRLWVGVPPRVTLPVWREFPHPHRILRCDIAEASLRRCDLRTAAEGGLCSPASGRGEVSSLPERFNQITSRSKSPCVASHRRCGPPAGSRATRSSASDCRRHRW